MTDTAGLHFIVSTPAQTLDKNDRKAIRSHATRAGVVPRQAPKLPSWISPDRELAVLEKSPSPEAILSIPSLKRVGAAFSGLQLPSGVEPYMIQDLVKCIQSPLFILARLPLASNDAKTN